MSKKTARIFAAVVCIVIVAAMVFSLIYQIIA